MKSVNMIYNTDNMRNQDGWSDENGNALDFICVNPESDSNEIDGSDRHDENMMDQGCQHPSESQLIEVMKMKMRRLLLVFHLVPIVKHFVVSARFSCRKHHCNRILHCWFTILLDLQLIESAPRVAFQVPEDPSVQGLIVPSDSGWD
jgi:methyl coenzyme M reductase subunit C